MVSYYKIIIVEFLSINDIANNAQENSDPLLYFDQKN